MKFGRQLLQEVEAAPPELAKSYMSYKSLKKMLKYRSLSTALAVAEGVNLSREDAQNAEKDFLRMLYTQLKAVNRKFESEYRSVMREYDAIRGGCCGLCSLFGRRSAATSQSYSRLAQRAHHLRQFAEVNAQALRKIAKKRDRRFGGHIGDEFIQACLRGETKVHSFLSASALAELAAVEEIMRRKAAAAAQRGIAELVDGQSAVELGALVGSETDMAQSLVVPAQFPQADTAVSHEAGDVDFPQEVTCAVCLDLLYQPVALECEHIFCARCAVNVAVGHERLVGNADSLLFNVAAFTERSCPCCRTAVYGKDKDSVFWKVKRLNTLERLIQEKYPREYQRRQKEDAEQQAALKAEQRAAGGWRSLLRTSASVAASAAPSLRASGSDATSAAPMASG